jgi:hypothetical protein
MKQTFGVAVFLTAFALIGVLIWTEAVFHWPFRW